jgi:SAM-dependent methyltransferase
MEKPVADGDDHGPAVTTAGFDDEDYRSFVGPSQQYDVMGAMQFSLLYALGLRAQHRLLDIGCGSLRAGRLFIPYLDKGGYAGLEPNKWLIEEALDNDIGREIVAIKGPRFTHNDRFDLSGLGEFDFILAQSIASHTGPAMTRMLLEAIGRGLAPGGRAAVTFIHTARTDNTTEGWFYPQCVRYRRRTIHRWIREAGLVGAPLAWYHPRQTWWVLARDETTLPTGVFRNLAWGGTLAMGPSWRPSQRARRRARRLLNPVIHRLVRPGLESLRHRPGDSRATATGRDDGGVGPA